MYGAGSVSSRRWLTFRPTAGTMFQRRDIPPVLLLLLLIILVMLTLSQILVVHNGRYGRNIHSLRKIQMELRELDIGVQKLLMQNVPSVELNRKLMQNEVNLRRIRGLLKDTTGAQVGVHNFKTLRTLRRQIESRLDGLQLRTKALNESYRDLKFGKQAVDRGRLRYCPAIPPGLTGRVFTHLHLHNYTLPDVVLQHTDLLPGGSFRPRHCIARHKVAVIVPYRDRKEHLTALLSHLHPILKRQQLDYRIFVVEQFGTDIFNKARIMNIGFLEALKLYNFQCFVFHDVDLVPEDDRNMYTCPTQPRHLSVAIDEMGYKLAYPELVGGVLNMRTEHFQRVNGYSNMYWGWGAEDDDLAYRILHIGLKITRPPDYVARYKMIKHTKRKPSDWRKRTKLLYLSTRRYQVDGLNSLKYRLVFIREHPLYTHIMADIGPPPRGF